MADVASSKLFVSEFGKSGLVLGGYLDLRRKSPSPNCTPRAPRSRKTYRALIVQHCDKCSNKTRAQACIPRYSPDFNLIGRVFLNRSPRCKSASERSQNFIAWPPSRRKFSSDERLNYSGYDINESDECQITSLQITIPCPTSLI